MNVGKVRVPRPNAKGQPQNLLPPGMAALKHQTHRWLTRGLAPACDVCVFAPGCPRREDGASCPMVAEERERMVSALLSMPHIDPATDGPLVHEYVSVSLAVCLIDAWVGVRGMFIERTGPGGKVIVDLQPAIKTRLALARHVLLLANELRLTPRARAALAATENVAAQVALTVRQVDEELRAEFSAEDVQGA